MQNRNHIVGADIRVLGSDSCGPVGSGASVDLLTDGEPDTGVGWDTGAAITGLEAAFRGSARADVVVCRWSAMPAEYVVETRTGDQWMEADRVSGNPVLGPKMKLHLLTGTAVDGIRIRIVRALDEDIHGREQIGGLPVLLSGLQAYSTDRLPSHIELFLERETPCLFSSPERVARARARREGEWDPAWLETPIPEWTPIPRALYHEQQPGREVNEKNGLRQQQLGNCSRTYEQTGDERFAARAREVLLTALAHYDRYQTVRFKGIDWKAVTYQDPAYAIQSLTRAYDQIASSACLTVHDRLRFVFGLLDLGEFQCDALRDRFVARENWAANSVAEIAMLALCFRGFPETRRWLSTAEARFAECFEDFLDDGYWWECSPSHSVYMLRGMLKYGLARHLLGDPVWRTKFGGTSLESAVESLCKTVNPFGEYPAINDSTGNGWAVLDGTTEIRAPLYLMGRGDFLEVLRDSGEVPFVPGVEVSAPERIKPSYTSVLLPHAGLAVMRDGWGKDDGYLVLDYGPHGGGHGHPDKLSFILVDDGHHWIPDAGNSPHYCIFPEQKTWHKQTISHNTILADGKSQEPCTGELVYWHHDEEVDAVCARHTEGYKGLEHRRTIVHPHGDYYMVHDELAAEGTGFDLEWLLHVNGEVEGQEPGKMWFRSGDKGLLLLCDDIGEEQVAIHQGLCGGFRGREWSGPGYPGPGDPGWIYLPYIRLPKRIEARRQAEFLAVLVPFLGERPDVRLEQAEGKHEGTSGAVIYREGTVDEYDGDFRRSIDGEVRFQKVFGAGE